MKKNKLLFLVPALLIGLSMQAQSAWLCGVVSDEQGEPMPGVTVQVKGLGGCTTDTDGFYQFAVPSGEYELEFRTIGYAAVQAPVVVSEKTVHHQDITLAPAAIQLGEVCIVAFKVGDIQSCTIVCGGVYRNDCYWPNNYHPVEDQPKLEPRAEPAAENPVLYPNPAHTFTRLALAVPAVEVAVFDAKGALVHRIQNIGAGVYEMPTQDWPAGVYSVAVSTGEQTQAIPLIIVHD